MLNRRILPGLVLTLALLPAVTRSQQRLLPVGKQLVSYHLGGATGFTSFLGYLPAQDATVIIAGNSNIDPQRVGAELARAAAGVPQPVSQRRTAAEMARYAGTYEGDGVKAVVRPKGDVLEADITGTGTTVLGFPVRLMKQNDTTFLVDLEPQSRVVFDSAGSVPTSITVFFGSRSVTLKR